MKLDIPFSIGRSAKSASFPRTSISMFGIDVVSASMEDARRILVARVQARIFTKIAFINAHCVNVALDVPDYRRALDDFVVMPDGVGVDLAARLLQRRSFLANLNGTDFLPYLFARTAKPMRVGLLGAAPGVADTAAAALAAAYPQHAFHVISHGFFAKGAETEAVKAKLRHACPDVLLVALGVPNQELFIAEHVSGADCTLAFGVGAFLDFMAGRVPRAPAVARALRLEWLFRLAHEPRRLWRRYLVGNPVFMARVFAEGLRQTRRRPEPWHRGETPPTHVRRR
ncbi:hypothetical protein ASG43_20090 [Aureimonas sp. Leaf454]|uniref:WecB/TagA/CpsF family glycosyltransferase n=1 Tax=Aureimonas sp. Leaf454 TaxID=1736381 RepID=UPI0006F32770|nr:WecB/TagA/CpsF family glycosyltransferase [Aureimonas sp. Leaf454]KQT52358.1 hypothetical protein ASG43_20090 [Aureimonas sp. Leaf454]